MKLTLWIIALLLTVLLIAVLVIVLTGKKRQQNVKSDMPECGGTTDYTDTNAPKHIVSDEIVKFYCEFSTLAMNLNDYALAGKIFKLEAVPGENNRVNGVYETIGRFSGDDCRRETFETDITFMRDLQKIIKSCDLAKHNGIGVRVSGLPNQYGAILDVKYISGEYIYANNNELCFLPYDAAAALEELFRRQIDK